MGSEGEHKGEMIIGKNTLIKKALKFLMKLNVGLIFSEEPYLDLKKKIEAEKISMPARTGVISPTDVVIPAGPTGIEVGKIDLFHKLNIQCKTVKSAIEISKEIRIISKGEKVTEGATQLCKLLQIVPFEYSLSFQNVYIDGIVLDQSIIDMPETDITDAFEKYSGFLTAASLGANIPNTLSVPHFIGNAFKSLLAIGAESGYSFKALEQAMEAGKNAPVAEAKAEEAVKKVEAKAAEEDKDESEDASFGMDGLFD